ncbi:hypothetical protein SAMN05660443_1336 [Marinospirillum celere]|uniref:Uncharacterized protein n=1 Tax=Marinospirillum celere TaxID=1122252 RepID=A0A1I1G0Y3_9GAMM|nr:hypothetical protein [Marinospirillum celere]SFC05274.1 hypothetical protein SAMN05660443_1336 [Marinospirillum celere]
MSYLPVFLGLTLLFLSLAVTVVFDFFGVSALALFFIDDYPLVYYSIFSEGRTIEKLQWFFLASGALLSALVYGSIGTSPARSIERRAFFLFSAGFFLMFLEDWMNIRHLISSAYMIPLFEAWLSSTQARMIWEAVFYFFLASIMVGAFWCLLKSGSSELKPNKRLTFGFVLYGMVGFGSAFRRLFEWQERLGNTIIDSLNLKAIEAWQEAFSIYYHELEQNPDYGFSPGYLLVDHLVEESLELIAASFLLSGLLAISLPYYRKLQSYS